MTQFLDPDGQYVKYRRAMANFATRYRFQQAFHVDSIQPGKLWVSDPAKFNDPFDLRIHLVNDTYRSPFDDELRLREAYKVLAKDNATMADHWFYNDDLLCALENWANGASNSEYVLMAVKRRIRDFGVACFAPELHMPLMWSHYGESHAGFCVEYAVNPMKIALSEKDAVYSQHDVEYATVLPKICLSEVLFCPHQVLPRILTTKHADWAYEKEWRLIHFEAKNAQTPLPTGMKVSALVAGLKMRHTELVKLLAKARELGVAAFQIKQIFQGYDLYREPLYIPDDLCYLD